MPSEILERAAQVTRAQLQVAARAASHDLILPMAGAVLDWIGVKLSQITVVPVHSHSCILQDAS